MVGTQDGWNDDEALGAVLGLGLGTGDAADKEGDSVVAIVVLSSSPASVLLLLMLLFASSSASGRYKGATQYVTFAEGS
jgi:hypothetical protein